MRNFLEKYSEQQKGQFKLLYVNFLFGYIPFAVLHIIFNLLHIIPVNLNGKQIFGFKAVIVIILFTPFTVAMITFFVWIYFMIGNLFLRLLKKIFV